MKHDILEIKWQTCGETRYYSQKIGLTETQVRLGAIPYAGAYLASLFGACTIDTVGKQLDDCAAEKSFFDEWTPIVPEECRSCNSSPDLKKYVLFDSVAFLAFCIVQNIKTMLREVLAKNGQPNIRSAAYSYRILGKDLTEQIAQQDRTECIPQIQDRIDRYIAQYNCILAHLREPIAEGFYEQLKIALRKYAGEDGKKLFKSYISAEAGHPRCFATFVRQDTREKLVSLSGFLDAQDPDILNWLYPASPPGQQQKKEFINAILDICSSFGATYVPIDPETRLYKWQNGHSVAQDDALGDRIAKNSDPKTVKGSYSCCERKIFGHYKDKTPNGDLYVKLAMCDKCIRGFLFQLSGGADIIIHDGLGV